VHLIGFIIRVYHDARSSECQIRVTVFGDNQTGVEPTYGVSFMFNYSVTLKRVQNKWFNESSRWVLLYILLYVYEHKYRQVKLIL